MTDTIEDGGHYLMKTFSRLDLAKPKD